MSDPVDFLDFAFPEDYAPPPYKAPVLPAGNKTTAILTEIADPELDGDGVEKYIVSTKEKTFGRTWLKRVIKYEVDDPDYLTRLGKDRFVLSHDLMIEVDPESKRPLVPQSPDDETNSGYRRWVKAHGKGTATPLRDFIGQRVTLILGLEEMQDRDGNKLRDEETGEVRKRLRVVAFGKVN